MTWTQFQDPKNPVTLHKLFGSLEHEERILDFFNALTDCDEDFEGATLTKVISIHPSRHPSLDFSAPLEGEVPVTGHMTFRIQDEEDTVHTLQLFVPQDAVFEKEVFFYAAKAYLEDYLNLPKTPLAKPVACYIFSPFALYEGTFDSAISDCDFMSDNDSMRWMNNLRFVFIELPKITYEPEDLTYAQDYWIYFFKHFHSSDAHHVLQQNSLSHVAEACDLLHIDQWSEEELKAYGRIQKGIALRQKNNPPEVEVEKRKAYRMGLHQGREEGKEDHPLKNNINTYFLWEDGERDLKVIAEKTGLAPHEVKELIKNYEGNDKSLYKEIRQKRREAAEAKAAKNQEIVTV